MAGKPGKQIGSWSSSEHEHADLFSHRGAQAVHASPGRRDDLIELFDREFVETQEAVGIQVIGQFRDLDDPNRFVWLRGFNDMSARATIAPCVLWRTHLESTSGCCQRHHDRFG